VQLNASYVRLDELSLNLSHAMKFKHEIQTNCGIEVKMLDTKEDGFVLYVERKSLGADLYKLLADFVAQKELNLQLEVGNFIISNHPLLSPDPKNYF
jgi:hypothetical protein